MNIIHPECRTWDSGLTLGEERLKQLQAYNVTRPVAELHAMEPKAFARLLEEVRAAWHKEQEKRVEAMLRVTK